MGDNAVQKQSAVFLILPGEIYGTRYDVVPDPDFLIHLGLVARLKAERPELQGIHPDDFHTGLAHYSPGSKPEWFIGAPIHTQRNEQVRDMILDWLNAFDDDVQWDEAGHYGRWDKYDELPTALVSPHRRL